MVLPSSWPWLRSGPRLPPLCRSVEGSTRLSTSSAANEDVRRKAVDILELLFTDNFQYEQKENYTSRTSTQGDKEG